MDKIDGPVGESDPRQAQIRLRLGAAGIDVDALQIGLRESTAVLTGTVQDAAAHMRIVEVLLADSTVNRVVDVLRVGSYAPSPQIYMKQGEPLAGALYDLFDPTVTWEEYRAEKKRIKLTQGTS